MPEAIPYGRQSVDEDDIAAVAEVLRGDFLTTGPMIPAFEAALAEAGGTRHAVAVSSGTAALHAMYFAAGIGPGDEIITSPLTFAATANAALYLGATVRFADVDPATGNLDPACVEPLVTPRTRAIVGVDYAGQPADYDALRELATGAGAALLADAAHSLGATDRGRPVGTLADASALSFHPVKPITTAEGGAVLTGDEELARRAARFRTHGITRDADELEADEGPWYYEQHDLGFNYRLTDVQAALGIAQLERLDGMLADRARVAGWYGERLAALGGAEPGAGDPDGLVLPLADRGAERRSWFVYIVRVPTGVDRDGVIAALDAEGIDARPYLPCIHLMPPYRERFGYGEGDFPVAEGFSRRAVALPFYPHLPEGDVERVVAALGRALG
ncbi:MAG: aminotransferase class I/II-fold pyridoxal phosphate-dependent enzyme, partial [Chloroflexota bacterium]|nr:aminotransferase class I/II-fold pyridoxal phosphate-dependent enzyme [Chloroflexota bacterium]